MTATIMAAALHGLHAAHTASDQQGQPLHIVHRDVSPQNIIVGSDGVTRVFDFGIAKARGRLQTTMEGQIKGKLAYMAPEQLSGAPVDPRTDVYAAAVVMWELLAGQRLFQADYEARLMAVVLEGAKEPPSRHNPSVPAVLDQIVMRALALAPDQRFASAREMAKGIEHAMTLIQPSEVGEWVDSMARDSLHRRAQRVAEIESRTDIATATAGDDALPTGPNVARQAIEQAPTVVDSGAHEALQAGTGSQLSSISVARDRPHPQGGRRNLPLLVAAALAIGAGAGLAVVLSGPGGDSPTTGAAATTGIPAASSAPTGASLTEAPELAPAVEAVVEQGLGSDPADVAASGEASAVTNAAPTGPKPTARADRGKPATATPAGKPTSGSKPNCDPPYVVNPKGIRIPKPECLR
jgi:serine/threonine-protein kinase